MRATAGIVTFPGSNGDRDALHAYAHVIGIPARLIDYRETDLAGLDLVVIPGGFSYGDHLRCGAIARFAPIMEPLREFAGRGGPVLGICNGFQVLTEAHLLPGAMLPNQSLEFHCAWVHVRVESDQTAWSGDLAVGTVLRLPVAHGEGAYYADGATLDRLESRGQILLRYCDAAGHVDETLNFNGSKLSIAGISNECGNVVGLMPHPERACEELLGGVDGLGILRSALSSMNVSV